MKTKNPNDSYELSLKWALERIEEARNRKIEDQEYRVKCMVNTLLKSLIDAYPELTFDSAKYHFDHELRNWCDLYGGLFNSWFPGDEKTPAGVWYNAAMERLANAYYAEWPIVKE